MRKLPVRASFLCLMTLVLSLSTGCGGGGSDDCGFLEICWRQPPPPPTTPPPPTQLSIFDVGQTDSGDYEFSDLQARVYGGVRQVPLPISAGTVEVRSGSQGDGITIIPSPDFPKTVYQSSRVNHGSSSIDDSEGGETDFWVSQYPTIRREFLLVNTDNGGTQLDYTTFGIWEDSYDVGYQRGITSTSSIFGFSTLVQDIPTTGAARYVGVTRASYFERGHFYTNRVKGAAEVEVNFSNNSVVTRLRDMFLGDQPFRDVTGIGTIERATYRNFNGEIVGGFSGSIATEPAEVGQAGRDMTGTFAGKFFGPGAEEVGGVFEMGSPDASMVGGFVGKK